MLGKKYKMLKVNKNKRGGYATKRDFHRDRVNGWLKQLETSIPSNYFLSKLSNFYDINVEAELNKLNANQLLILSHLMASASTLAHEQQRTWARERQEAKKKDEV